MKANTTTILTVIASIVIILMIKQPHTPDKIDLSDEFKIIDSLKSANDSIMLTIDRLEKQIQQLDKSIETIRVNYKLIEDKYASKIKDNADYNITQLDSVIFAKDNLLR